MGLSQLDSSLSAKVGGTSTFTSRRDYQAAMAPRGTSAQTSDSERECQTRPLVLRLRGAGKPDLGVSDCRSKEYTTDLAERDSESPIDESSTYEAEDEQGEESGGDMSSCVECIPQPDHRA
jgi:hypothetical protein